MSSNTSHDTVKCRGDESMLHDNQAMIRVALRGNTRVKLLGPVARTALPVSKQVWKLLFPYSCCPDTVFYAAIINFAGGIWNPAVIISCTDILFPLSRRNMENLTTLMKIVAAEALLKPVHYEYEILHVDHYNGVIVAIVYPDHRRGPRWTSESEAIANTVASLVDKPSSEELEERLDSFLRGI